MSELPIVISAPPERNSSQVKVVRVEKERYPKAPERTATCGMNDFVTTSSEQACAESGAGPCTLYFAINRGNKKVTMGHFVSAVALLKPEKKGAIQRIKEVLCDKFTPLRPSLHSALHVRATEQNYAQYMRLLERIKEMQSAGQVELFLFGGNPNDEQIAAQDFEKTTQTRQQIVTDLMAIAGVSKDNIVDNRLPYAEYNADQNQHSDGILYLPDTQTIYWNHSCTVPLPIYVK